MAKEYGRDEGENRIVCPGEDNCEIFESAKGKTRKEKEKNSCIGGNCPLFPTKANTRLASETIQTINYILYSAIDIRRDRLSGSSINKSRISTRVYECLKIMDDLYDAFERDLKLDHKRYLEILIKKPSL